MDHSFTVQLDFKHANLTTLDQFFHRAQSVLGRKDFSKPLEILKSHWVENVGDLRLLIQEGILRKIGLPLRLCYFIEKEVGLFSDSFQISLAEAVEEKKPVAANTGLEFHYEADFDTNGIIYWLGSIRGTQTWNNPAVLGLVKVSSSGLMGDSEPESAMIGRTASRCVTVASESAWFCIDFIDFTINPTCYTLRHYISWDTECLRFWNLEASNDGNTWVILREHRNDKGLDLKGGSCTWTIPASDSYYRIFRVRMTGPNSNNHMYLAQSGFEIYGRVQHEAAALDAKASKFASSSQSNKAAQAAPPSVSASSHDSLPQYLSDRKIEEKRAVQEVNRTYTYSSDFDNNGLFYDLATRSGSWVNPALSEQVRLSSSSLMMDSEPLHAVLGRDIVRCVTKPVPDSWIMVDLICRQIEVSAYTLRHYSTWDTEALRNWNLEGSNDHKSWTIISQHQNDESLKEAGATHTWTIDYSNNPSAKKSFRFLRIFQTGENSNKHCYLACSGFEVYGEVSPLPHSRKKNIAGDEVFEYKGIDFDIGQAGGIVNHLALLQGTYFNPMISGEMRVLMSSLGPETQLPSAAVGRDVVRCVTKPELGSWFIFDFVHRKVIPTAYSLRHYSTWDTEAVRNWRFEGSNDGVTWTLLREHVKDSSLQFRGSAATWKLKDTGESFRLFRVLLTGPNSNQHHYLAISGFELFGTLSVGPQPAPLVKIPNGCVDISGVPKSSTSEAKVLVPVDVKSANMANREPDSDSKGKRYTWDPLHAGTHLEVDANGTTVRNTGSSDKWQMIRSRESVSSGVVMCNIKVTSDPATSNNWRFIVGVVGTNLDCKGLKQWVGTQGSWGYIAGTGGKCHKLARSVNYSSPYKLNDVIGIKLDFNRGTITFYKNHVKLGVAYENLTGPVHFAASLTATDSALTFGGMEVGHWNQSKMSKFLVADEIRGTIRNTGSLDKWQSARSLAVFGEDPDETEAYFEIEILKNPETPNSWNVIVGVVPETFTCSGSKQWVGAGSSWGYIAGTGGVCYNAPRSTPYGSKYGDVGDVIGVSLDFRRNRIEYFLNGESQGVAFDNLRRPVYAACSITATDSCVALRIWR